MLVFELGYPDSQPEILPVPRRCLPLALALALTGAVLTVPARSAAPPAPHPGPGADPAAVDLDKNIMAEVKKNSELMKNLTHISDVIGPRLTGSAALARANEWTAEKMRGYGLTNVRLEPW